ncbi:hypothetical protein BDZ97DRAFT_1758633 [Flammula alnicola]|nr:hypothetical protein BDZ97DRAFT_1758633 [Flammula alnicola]
MTGTQQGPRRMRTTVSTPFTARDQKTALRRKSTYRMTSLMAKECRVRNSLSKNPSTKEGTAVPGVFAAVRWLLCDNGGKGRHVIQTKGLTLNALRLANASDAALLQNQTDNVDQIEYLFWTYWKSTDTTCQEAIIGAVNTLGVITVLVLLFLVYCMVQRRRELRVAHHGLSDPPDTAGIRQQEETSTRTLSVGRGRGASSVRRIRSEVSRENVLSRTAAMHRQPALRQ